MTEEGKGFELFKHIKKLIRRSEVLLRIIYFNHDEFQFDSQVTPNALAKVWLLIKLHIK